jgi:hypothetical protein
MIDITAYPKLRLMDWAKPVFILFFILLAFTTTQGSERINSVTRASKSMETFYIGRFSIAIPAEMKEAGGSRSHKVRDFKLSEIVWPKGISHVKAREAEWKKYLAEIKKPTLSKTAEEIIIKTQVFPRLGKWAEGVFYFASNSTKTANWAVLMDTGPVGVWVKTNPPVLIDKENRSNNAAKNISTIGKSYHEMDSNTARPKGDWFYLKHGAINLPYLWQEKSYIRFEGHPLDLKIEIDMDMDAGHKRPQFGLIEKASATIDSGYASAANVSIKNIRSQKREVAGMPGDEVIDRLTDKDKKTLDFGWEYIGRKDSGEYPTIRITMESPDGNLDEKLKIWDAVLDSLKPMFERNK